MGQQVAQLHDRYMMIMMMSPDVSKKFTGFIFMGSRCLNFEPLKMKTKRRLRRMQRSTVTPQYTETLDYITLNASKLTTGCDIAPSCMLASCQPVRITMRFAHCLMYPDYLDHDFVGHVHCLRILIPAYPPAITITSM